MKIILLGFPKSGTSSFQKLFTQLGYKSYHWRKGNKYIGVMIKENYINNKPLLNDFSDKDVITQMDVCIDKDNAYWPQILHYRQIYEENKNSIFILNKRNPKQLLDSFKGWKNLNKRLYNYNPELIYDKTDNGFINFVLKFYNEVEEYFSQHTESKFLTYDIDNDTIDKLKPYIDIKNIKLFPKKNVNKKRHTKSIIHFPD